MKRSVFLFLLLILFCEYTIGQTQHNLAELKQDGLDEYGLGYLCTSQGERLYVTRNNGLFLGFIWEITGENGTIIELPAQTEVNVIDDENLEVIFAGRKMEVPIDSIRNVCDYYRNWKKDLATPIYTYSFQHDSPVADEESTDTDIHLYADFPIGSNTAFSHIRFWMSQHIYERMRYITESFGEIEPLGYYYPNNDQSPKQMCDSYGDYYRVNYWENIHLTVSDFEYGGLRLEQGFELQSLLSNAVTYLYTDAVYAQGNSYGSENCCYFSFDRKTGRLIEPEDLFRPETMHQLKERILNELYKVINERDTKYYERSYSDLKEFLVLSDMTTYLGVDEDTPIENVIDSIPIQHVALLDEGVIITYLPFEILCFGAGPTWIILPYNEIEGFMKPYRSGPPLPGGNLTITNDSLISLRQQAYEMANNGQKKEGIKTFKKAVYCAQQLEGTQSEAYNYWLWNFLDYCVSFDEVVEAERLMKEMTHRYSEETWYTMGYPICEKMIQLYAQRKEYEKVLELLPKSHLGIYEQAYYNYYAGHIDKAIEYAKECIADMMSDVRTQLKDLIGEERDKAWSKMSYWFTEFLPLLAYKTQDEELLRGAYDALLLGKGILLNTETSFQQHILNNGDQESLSLFEKKKKTKRKLQVEKRLTSEQNDNTFEIEELESQIKILEKQLIGKSKRYGDYTRQMQIRTSDVCMNIDSNEETAIEFACISNNDSTHYIAFVLNSKTDTPKAVYVCNGDELNSCIKNGIPDMSNLYQFVWKRIEQEVELKSLVSFSPSGLLHNLSIEYALLPDGRLFSDVHKVCRYSSTRELVIKRQSQNNEPFSSEKSNVALFGGINYNNATNEIGDENRHYENNNAEVKHNIQRGAIAITSFSYLPQTLEEVMQISEILRQSPNPPIIDIYEGSGGTETAFKNLSGKQLLITHIATHGFFFSKDEIDENMGWSRYFSSYQKNSNSQEEKALSCSGLLMAGASNVLNEGETGNSDDGVLTASEISTLDLSSVNMVVLSACQTACGELSGDGIFGLQRGFKKAGVKTLLMSLWNVDDEATKLLMVEFYKKVLNHYDYWTALKESVNFLRTIENGKYSSPEYWAAFILLD